MERLSPKPEPHARERDAAASYGNKVHAGLAVRRNAFFLNGLPGALFPYEAVDIYRS